MALTTHRDWSTPSFDLPPVAPAVGPFPRRDFLRSLASLDGSDVTLVDDGGALVAVVESAGRVSLAGHRDLVDYRSPLGEGARALVAAYASRLPAGTEIDFDSLPPEAADPVLRGLEEAGLRPSVEQHTVAAVIDLPSDHDEYLHAIGKKQRHEVRRKRRRYEQAIGPLLHETHRGTGWGLDEFFRLHRLAAGDKGGFMTPEREAFFRELAASPGWRTDVLRVPGTERAAAALFSFVDRDGLYLYNSSYDQALSDASPGVAIIGSMIEQAIAEGIPRFDFLKGDEVYKFRLGASERPLHRIRATT